MKRLFYGLVCCLLLAALNLTTVQGDDAEQKQTAKQETFQSKKTGERVQAEEDKKKQKAQTIGALLLVLVLFLGFVSILFAVFWGRRIRRMLDRHRTSTTEQVDEFWYLQPDKKENDISNEPSSEE